MARGQSGIWMVYDYVNSWILAEVCHAHYECSIAQAQSITQGSNVGKGQIEIIRSQKGRSR